jgi:hypothetical protein
MAVQAGQSASISLSGDVAISGKLSLTGGTNFPSASPGDIYYHTTSNKHFGWNGSTWNALY